MGQGTTIRIFMTPLPPTVNVDMTKSPTDAAAALGDRLLRTASGLEETVISPSRNDAATTSKPLVLKIQTILDMPYYSSIISWNNAGTAVIIHDVNAFISEIMPAHFFHQSTFDSFTRMMRRWGFRVGKQRSSPSTSSERGQSTAMEFSCEHFIRDQPDLCLLMKDERVGTNKQFTCLDRAVKVDGSVENRNQASRVCVHNPPSSGGGIIIPCPEDMEPHPDQYPPSSSYMIPPHHPPLHYSPYGYGASPVGLGFGPTSHATQYAPYGYPPYPQQHQQVMMTMDDKASAAKGAAVLPASSDKSSELEILPVTNRKRTNEQLNSQIDTEQKVNCKERTPRIKIHISQF